MVKMNSCAAIDFRPSVSLFGRQGGGCRRFPFGKWRLLSWETENSKHSKCMYTYEIRRGTTGISLQNSKQAPVSTHTGACHSGKQCTAVPTCAKTCWGAGRQWRPQNAMHFEALDRADRRDHPKPFNNFGEIGCAPLALFLVKIVIRHGFCGFPCLEIFSPSAVGKIPSIAMVRR